MLPRLTDRALHYGAALKLDDPMVLTTRLYGFNRLPLAPKLLASLPQERHLREFVLSGAPALTGQWRSRRFEQRSGWLSWIRRDGSSRSPSIAHKLYISPLPEAILDTLRTVAPLLTESDCVAFKLGVTPSFLARPDKLVAYFADREAMLGVAHEATLRLGGVPAHGAPFTFPVDADSLVSYGFDPPHGPDELTSWRIWLCSELAQAMVDAGPEDGVSAAQARLIALGIDPLTWQAPENFWEQHGSG